MFLGTIKSNISKAVSSGTSAVWKSRGIAPATISKIVSASNTYSGPKLWFEALNFFMNDPVFDKTEGVEWFLKATLPGGESKVKIPVDEAHLKAATWASSIFGKGATRTGLVRFISKYWPMAEWRGRFLAFRGDSEDYIGQSEAASGMLTDEQIATQVARIEGFQKSSHEYETRRGAATINFRVPFTDVNAPPKQADTKLRVDDETEEGGVGRTIVLLGVAGLGLFFLTRGGIFERKRKRKKRK